MNRAPTPRQLGELAAHVGGELLGDAGLLIQGLNGLAEAGPGDVSFYGNTQYRQQYEATRASAVLVGADAPPRDGLALVRVPNPHLAFARLLVALPCARPPRRRGEPPGVRPPRGARAPRGDGDGGRHGGAGRPRGRALGALPGRLRGRGGPHRRGLPALPQRHGARALPGGRARHPPRLVRGGRGRLRLRLRPEGDSGPEHFKIPQAGIVRIEDDVEVGACTCIDRATLGETVIGRGTKIDNLVQIAHNVKVGPLSLICAQAGVSGSAELGTGVVLAGQVGVVGHIRVGDMAKVGAQSGVAHDVQDGQVVSGSPADRRTASGCAHSAALSQLGDLLKEVRALRRRVELLEKEKGG